MSRRWLHLRFAGPLMAFGGVTIDQVGPTREFPLASMLAGLLANALGWRREERAAHQDLQDRLVFAALTAREGRLLTDSQNAKLEKNDRGWTTWGEPEGRAGATYGSPHRRRRDYLADHDCRVLLWLAPGAGPSTEDIAAALDRPARPLFIGRKPCLPSAQILAGWVEAASAREALVALGLPGRAIWPVAEGAMAGGAQQHEVADLRNWRSGLHGGARIVIEGAVP